MEMSFLDNSKVGPDQILECEEKHAVRRHWGNAHYPLVPGHEIVGRVISVGKNVTRFKVGDNVGVGCMVDSCGTCQSCKEGHEQHCINRATYTYDSPDKISGGYTQGGYSKTIVVKEPFVIIIPKNLDLSLAAPLLCAGITTYSPIIKLAVSKGAEVTAFTTTPSKIDDIKRFGAKEAIVVDDPKSLKKHSGSLDYLISTIPQNYDINRYIRLVKRDGIFTQVGVPGDSYSLSPMALVTLGG